MSTPPSHRTGYTFRSFLVGSIFAAFLAAGAPYGNMVVRGSYMSLDFSTPGALFLFFVLVGVLNVALKLLAPVLSLSRSELLVVYSMMLIASAVTTSGLCEYLVTAITAWHYYATPENQWVELFHHYIPAPLVPGDPLAIKYFYEGLPAGAEVPWGVWMGPLLLWSSLVLAIYFAMICAAVILRRQWMEREKLLYPLAHLPLEMVRESDEQLLPPLFKNPVMWVGFALPFLISSINALHNYFQVFPQIRLSSGVPFFRTAHLPFTLSFPQLGFAYLINRDIALGLWLFNVLVFILQRGLYDVLGIADSETLDVYSISPASIAHQGMGAMIVLVGFSLWVGREHLKDVVRKAVRGDAKVDDAGEVLSYRAAFWGTVGGLTFAGVWLYCSGIPLLVIPLFLASAFIIFIGMSRIVAESGVPVARSPMMPQSFVTTGIGTGPLGGAGLMGLSLTFTWATELRTVVMSSAAHGLKLIEGNKARARPFFWALMLALVVSMGSAIWALLELSYRYGGINLNPWYFHGGARAPFESFLVSRLQNPTGPNWDGWISTGIGAGAMTALMICRYYFVWWPIHPLGYPIAGLWLVKWFSIFLAWLCKGIVLKYWGSRGYRATRPFFLGIILGQFFSAGLWLVIDACTGMTDSWIFRW